DGGEIACRREDRRAAKAVADQQGRRLIFLPKIFRRLDDIGDIGGEIGVGELPVAFTKPGEIEAQRGDAEPGQRFGDPACRRDILRAGEAMGEERIGERFSDRQIEPRGERTVRSLKGDLFAAHYPLLSVDLTALPTLVSTCTPFAKFLKGWHGREGAAPSAFVNGKEGAEQIVERRGLHERIRIT